jgi:hypothetical protein
MAVTTMDGLVAAIAAGQSVQTLETSITTVASSFFSLWTAPGNPGAGATPASGAGAAPTNATAGAIPFTNPGGSNTAYLAKLGAYASQIETLLLVDRLVHTAGLSGTVITAQTVSSTAITRNYPGGTANANGLWIEVYGALGATGATATVIYTNQAGATTQSGTATIPASAKVGALYPVSLASGDYGVRAVTSVQLSISTGTAGSFGVTLTWSLASIVVMLAGTGQALDYAGLGLPVVQSGACLGYYVLCNATASGNVLTNLLFAQG